MNRIEVRLRDTSQKILSSSTQALLKWSLNWKYIEPIGIKKSLGIFKYSGTDMINQWIFYFSNLTFTKHKKNKIKLFKRGGASLRSQHKLCREKTQLLVSLTNSVFALVFHFMYSRLPTYLAKWVAPKKISPNSQWEVSGGKSSKVREKAVPSLLVSEAQNVIAVKCLWWNHCPVQ